jgi:hypothetical protein
MENLMVGVKISIQMEDIMKDLLLMVYHMVQGGLLWKTEIFIKVKLNLVEPMEVDIF